MKTLLVVLITAIFCVNSYSQTKVSAQDASKHIGDSVTVLDKVYSVKVFENGMTLLNVGGLYPNHLLVIMIRPEHLTKFSYKPAEQLKGKQILVSGKLIDYNRKPEIIVTDPKQIQEVLNTDTRSTTSKQF